MEDGKWWKRERRSLQDWGGKGESLVEHYRVIKKWIGFLFEVFFMFICFLLPRITAFGALLFYLLHSQKPAKT